MTATYLVFSSFLIVLFFMVGLFIGWSAREYMMNYQEGPKQIAYHPEFYNKNGELIDQEIVILLSVAAAAKIANSCGCTEIILNN